MKKIVSLVCFIFLFLHLSVSAAEENWLWPTETRLMSKKWITQKFGGGHSAIDIGGAHGESPIYAAKSGYVALSYDGCRCISECKNGEKKCSHNKTCGNYVIINHGNGIYSRYIHLHWKNVAKKGQYVKQGDVIGFMGSTGRSSGTHLDFSIYVGGTGASGGVVLDGRKIDVNPKNVYSYGAIQYVTVPEYDGAKSEKSKLFINCTQYPTSLNQGSSFGLRGDISSNYNITSVNGYIINSGGANVQTTSDSPNSTYFNIRSGKLNTNMIFGDLSPGNYVFKIVAKDSSGETKTFERSFSVVAKSKPQATPSPTKAPVVATPNPVPSSSIKISLDSVPKGNLKYGKSFSLSGKFTSDCAIVEAKAYLLDTNKNVVMQAKGSSTTGNYYIKGYALDKGMKFGKLQPGGYYLRYTVRDANGDTAEWTSDKFYIVK